jgi:hypothetical protein
MIKSIFVSILTFASIVNAEQIKQISDSMWDELRARKVYQAVVGTYIFNMPQSKSYLRNKNEYLTLRLLILEHKKSIEAQKERARLMAEKSRFEAYTKALETCLVVTPVSNETTQSSSAGIQSDWCVSMRKSFAADMVTDLAQSKGISKAQLDTNQELVGQLIQELRDSKKLTLVEAGQIGSLRHYQRSSSSLSEILSQSEANQ